MKDNIKYLAIILVLILILGGLSFYAFKLDNNSAQKVKKTTKEKPVQTEEEKKLEKLNNINKNIDYFNINYLDRYISFKEKHADYDDEKIVLYVNMGLDYNFYENTEKTKYLNQIYVIANKHYYLGEDYVPDNLVKLPSYVSKGAQYMVKEASDQFVNMYNASRQAGLKIRAMSAYRSAESQKIIYNNYVNRDGQQEADTYSSRSGYSDHQTGLAVDIDDAIYSYTKFKITKEYIWMKDNAHKYGFIQRYPEGKEEITGYICEEWHWRYVGVETATYIHDNNITFEEYYEKFINNKK